MKEEKPRDIRERTYEYALRAVRLYQVLTENGNGASLVLGKQYLRSATSIGANMEEAQSAESRPDFIHKCTIAQKEARESLYWLRLLIDAELLKRSQTEPLVQETEELVRIITTILVNTKHARPKETLS